MKQFFYLWLLAIGAVGAQAQQKVQDGTGTPATPLPAAGSLLELQSDRAGLRLPQIALTSSGSWTPLLGTSSAVTSQGMMVYNTAVSPSCHIGMYFSTIFPGRCQAGSAGIGAGLIYCFRDCPRSCRQTNCIIHAGRNKVYPTNTSLRDPVIINQHISLQLSTPGPEACSYSSGYWPFNFSRYSFVFAG